MNGFPIPGIEQAEEKVKPVNVGNGAAKKLRNLFCGGSLAAHHG
jgi:hypothetical protein